MPLLPNETTLMHQMILGDADAFRQIYEAYQKQVYTFAYFLTKSQSDAEEVVQEIFVRLWEKRSLLTEDTKLLAYIKAMTQNHITNTFRKAARDKTYREQIFRNIAALQQASAGELMEAKISKIYQEALMNLSPQKRIIFTLSRHKEMTYEEIAEKLGLSKNTVRNHMTEALRSVRDYVEGHPDISCLVIAIILSGTRS
jgi:RNA polymerase sigma-70 factor (family 1)